MVFENLTLFELHLENSRFGPSFGSDEEQAEEVDEAATESSDEGGSGGRMRPLGVLLLIAVVAMAVRRYRASKGAEEELPEAESEQITIEHSAEQ